MKKRISSLLLCCIMICSSLLCYVPKTAFANENGYRYEWTRVEEDYSWEGQGQEVEKTDIIDVNPIAYKKVYDCHMKHMYTNKSYVFLIQERIVIFRLIKMLTENSPYQMELYITLR